MFKRTSVLAVAAIALAGSASTLPAHANPSGNVAVKPGHIQPVIKSAAPAPSAIQKLPVASKPAVPTSSARPKPFVPASSAMLKPVQPKVLKNDQLGPIKKPPFESKPTAPAGGGMVKTLPNDSKILTKNDRVSTKPFPNIPGVPPRPKPKPSDGPIMTKPTLPPGKIIDPNKPGDPPAPPPPPKAENPPKDPPKEPPGKNPPGKPPGKEAEKEPGKKIIIINKGYPVIIPAQPYPVQPVYVPVRPAPVYAPVVRPAPVYVPARPAPVAAPAIAAPSAAPSCLTKEYLENGLVLFKDTCSKDWAMNSTTQSRPVNAVAARTCLAKENLGDGVVLFRDICSGEWAKNPPDQQAEAPAAR